MDTPLIYLAYSRKSSESYEDRQIASIESQENELKEVQDKLGLNVIEYLSESRTAHETGRPVFNQMLDRIEQGQANAILTWHPNRLARNSQDAGRLIYLIDLGLLKEVRTPNRVFKNTPTDKFMLSLELTISKKDSDDKSEVVKRGLRNKLNMGWRPGVPPHGYLPDRGAESGTRKIHIDPERFPFIKKIFQMKSEGVAVRQILKTANQEWNFRTRPKKRSSPKPLSLSSLYSILKNPFYAGRFLFSGEWYEGKHERAVEPEVFDQIQIMLGAKGLKAKPHTHQFAYTGLIRCSCGGSITAETKTHIVCPQCKFKFSWVNKNKDACPRCKCSIADMDKPKIRQYCYYHCTRRVHPECKEPSIELKELEAQILDHLSRIEISDHFKEWAIARINEENEQEKEFQEDKIQSIKRAHDECREKLANLLKLKISPLNSDGSLISDVEFKSQKQALEVELNTIEKQLAEFDTNLITTAQAIAEKFNFACSARQVFANGDLVTKRGILSALGQNFLLKGKKLYFDSPKYYSAIKEIRENVPEISKLLEPDVWSYTSAQLELVYSSNPIVLRGVDSNH